jgi:hypothetical protein
MAHPQTTAAQPLQTRVAAISGAAASLDRRDARLFDTGEVPRFSLDSRAKGESIDNRRTVGDSAYRRSAQPRRAASSARRDQ